MTVKIKIIIGLIVAIVIGISGIFIYTQFFDYKRVELPEAVVGEEADYVFPYTGLKADSEQATQMRPLCIKIVNDAPARPQTNLNSADVVYETMIEGGETRMNAIFQSNIPEDVGPVRSARLSDIWIVPQYNGMLFFSGANNQVTPLIASNKITNMNWSNAESIYFRAGNGKGNLHNLHIKLNDAYDLAEEKGYETSSSALKPLHYEGVAYEDEENSADSKLSSLDESVSSGSSVKVKVSHVADIEFKWDEETGKYLKFMNGTEHMDAGEDKQINVSNAIILWAEYTQQAKKDSAGSPTYDTTLGGEGKAALFKDGKRYDCTWKADETTPPRFYDETGNEIPLSPGNTWIVVPPTNIEITSE